MEPTPLPPPPPTAATIIAASRARRASLQIHGPQLGIAADPDSEEIARQQLAKEAERRQRREAELRQSIEDEVYADALAKHGAARQHRNRLEVLEPDQNRARFEASVRVELLRRLEPTELARIFAERNAQAQDAPDLDLLEDVDEIQAAFTAMEAARAQRDADWSTRAGELRPAVAACGATSAADDGLNVTAEAKIVDGKTADGKAADGAGPSGGATENVPISPPTVEPTDAPSAREGADRSRKGKKKRSKAKKEASALALQPMPPMADSSRPESPPPLTDGEHLLHWLDLVDTSITRPATRASGKVGAGDGSKGPPPVKAEPPVPSAALQRALTSTDLAHGGGRAGAASEATPTPPGVPPASLKRRQTLASSVFNRSTLTVAATNGMRRARGSVMIQPSAASVTVDAATPAPGSSAPTVPASDDVKQRLRYLDVERSRGDITAEFPPSVDPAKAEMSRRVALLSKSAKQASSRPPFDEKWAQHGSPDRGSLFSIVPPAVVDRLPDPEVNESAALGVSAGRDARTGRAACAWRGVRSGVRAWTVGALCEVQEVWWRRVVQVACGEEVVRSGRVATPLCRMLSTPGQST